MLKQLVRLVGLAACLLALYHVHAQNEVASVVGLTVEYLSEPRTVAIDTARPRFSWYIDVNSDTLASHRGVTQASFSITVRDVDGDMVVWESGEVNSQEKTHIVYGSVGNKPKSRLKGATVYEWEVRVTLTSKGNTLGVFSSNKARFTTGLVGKDAWKDCSWMTGSLRSHNLLRKTFQLDSPVHRALLFVSGLGYFQAYVNGHRVSDAELEPGWTEYTKRVPYSTYDITDLVQDGENVLGLHLGNGWYSSQGGGDPSHEVPRMAIAKLIVNGQVLPLTEGGWRSSSSPITYDSIYNGEIYDGRIEDQVSGWSTVGYDASGWRHARATKGPTGQMVSTMMPPIRKVQVLTPLTISTPQPGIYVVDMGQNFAGRIALRITKDQQLEPGMNVTLRHAELLQHQGVVADPQKGMIYVDNLRSAKATDVYIFGPKKDTDIIYEPTFTYHGFRYVEVRGIKPQPEDIVGYVMHTDVPHTGQLHFPDDGQDEGLLNQIHSIIKWTQRANIMSVLTDCPQRDERKGWLGDAQLSSEESMRNFDMVATLRKFLVDIVDTQDSNGDISDTAPFTWGKVPADPSWGSALPSLVYWLWRDTGDKGLVKQFYDSTAKYMDSLVRSAHETGLKDLHVSYGDWCNVPGSPKCNDHLVASFSLIQNLEQMIVLANALDNYDDVSTYRSYLRLFRAEFHETFFSRVNRTYEDGQQTCLALPLWGKIVPRRLERRVGQQLLQDIMVNNDYHTTAGIVGFKHLLEVLPRLGRVDVALSMLERTDYPSLGYMITNEFEPATSVWELWIAPQEGPSMDSRNHIMFGGSVDSFFYKYLGGVRPLSSGKAAGYRDIIIAPPLSPCLSLTSLRTSIMTVQGPVVVDWSHDMVNSIMEVIVHIPVGATGRVVFDGSLSGIASMVVTEGGKAISSITDIDVITKQDDLVELTAPSGIYHFAVGYQSNSLVDCTSPTIFSSSPSIDTYTRPQADNDLEEGFWY